MFINYAGVLVLLGLKHKNFKIYVAGGFIKPGLRYWWSWKTDDNYTLLNKESRVPTDGYAYGDEEDIPDEHSKCFKHQWELSFDYKGIWDRRFELRKKYNLI